MLRHLTRIIAVQCCTNLLAVEEFDGVGDASPFVKEAFVSGVGSMFATIVDSGGAVGL